VTLVSVGSATARQAVALAAGTSAARPDAVYFAVARRYGTTLVSRDEE
jgi:predicted nucleic acid-binding protein